jgi:DNA modification methylase
MSSISTLDGAEVPGSVASRRERRYTHGFHPWAAKYVAEIAREHLTRFSSPGSLVIDPFCGSGTTLVEAALMGRRAIGFDISPVATLISKVKATGLSPQQLEAVPSILTECKEAIAATYNGQRGVRPISAFEEATGVASEPDKPEFVGLGHWFAVDMIGELAAIRETLTHRVQDPDLRDFLLVAFSAIIVPCSRQEGETRYAAIEKRQPPFTAYNLLDGRVKEMVRGMREFFETGPHHPPTVVCLDSREPWPVKPGSARLVLTSPPYANTYDYYLYHKLRMVWLGLDWENAKRNEIGSRNRHSSLGEGIESYVSDMARCLREVARALEAEGTAVFVVGDSVIGGVRHDALTVIGEAAKGSGLEVCEAISKSLDGKSRSFSHSFQRAGKFEHVILLKKSG